MSDWQPIATAPKTDFQRVLLSDGLRVREAYWSRDYIPPVGHGYWEMGGNSAFIHPTHWMPLPAPPARLAAPSALQPEEHERDKSSGARRNDGNQ